MGRAGVEHALAGVLADRPAALVAAIGEDGLFVPPPRSLPFEGRVVVQARAATDIVELGARTLIIDAWQQVRENGRSFVPVPLPGADEPAELHLFDVRSAHGVFAMVLDAGDDPPAVGPVAGLSTVGMAKVVRVRKDSIAVLRHVDASVTEVLGWAPQDLIGRRSLELIHPDDQDLAITAWMDMLEGRGLTTRARLRHLRADDGWTWLDISNTNLLDGTSGHVDCEMVDVTDEVHAQDALRASEQLLRRLTAAMPVGVFHIDTSRRLQLANARLHEILGTTPDASQTTMRGTVRDQLAFDRAIDAVLAGTDVDMEVDIQPIGSHDVLRCTLALRALGTDEEHITGAVGCLTDVTESVRLREELERRATVDELTGCLNRASVIDSLEEALGKGVDVAVVYVDVDDFKLVNDGHGHAAGDEVLQAVAARLRAALRGHDAVGRMGGDEFIAVCSGLGSEDGAEELRRRIADALCDPVAFGGRRLEISASVGVAWVPAGTDVDADALVARADVAMYEVKSANGSRRGWSSAPG